MQIVPLCRGIGDVTEDVKKRAFQALRGVVKKTLIEIIIIAMT